ncbi:5' exonuclease Apollo [Rhodamnia argentea]|uniref:5' exonuclease Apollo n=1 Tax=Rhodamnia argentea TaxID=178133 RepID=A0A8B8MQY9_9MYRT|nr:5' exonuclease Apollo [Rhodamnia argentea]
MPVEMPKGLPFSVDTWTPSSLWKRHRFLTHAHRDHSVGIASPSSRPIYSTRLTKALVLHHFPQLDGSLFVEIEAGQSLVVDDPDGPFAVTAFDANHCPGAVMFLFEGAFGNILHTGDCRLTPKCVLNLPDKYIGGKGKEPQRPLDFLYLDCTFGKYRQSMPSKHSAIRQVIDCIWKHPDAPVVYLTCDLLGQEEILAEVSRIFGSKIYVDKAAHPDCFRSLALTFPEILSEDPSSRFHLFDAFPRLSERAKAKLDEARISLQPEPLIIRPSSQWYACEEEYSLASIRLRQRFDEAVRDEFGVWHVCYSMHSSRDELEWALQTLAPKRVVSTTPNCWAMELDYVRRNCFGTNIASEDPIWNLLGINAKIPSDIDIPSECMKLPPSLSEQAHSFVDCGGKSAKPSTNGSEVSDLSPPSKRPSLTLFGRARIGFEGSVHMQEEKKIASRNDEPLHIICTTIQQTQPELSCREDRYTLEHCEESNEDKVEEDFAEAVQTDCKTDSFSSLGSSNNFNESMRKLYRSKNVSVPRPLPSLMKLNASRRAIRSLKDKPACVGL